MIILRPVCFALLFLCLAPALRAQEGEHSPARQWNEELLEAIRNDFARPVVHARNLYHVSAAMYDCWSLTTGRGTPALVNNEILPIDMADLRYEDPQAAAQTAASYAAYRVLKHRYSRSPGADTTLPAFNARMESLGLDTNYISANYRNGNPADLGNYVAQQIILFGMSDGANEAEDYALREYDDPVNPPLQFTNPFSIFQLQDPNRWQTLQFPGTVIDQSGNPLGDAPLPFLGAEWGRVTPFAMGEDDRSLPNLEFQYGVDFIYHDPGPPPTFTRTDTAELGAYRWNFETVLKWSSHLDPNDGVLWDISPGARGNLSIDYPTTLAEYQDFYLEEGGTAGATGHALNPVTGEPYPPNIVPRGDYTRILAEFWADGPASETPPGHWFDIFNGVMDHPLFERRMAGQGSELDAFEYEVKAYLALGGAMHDAAISAWSIKGAYDYIRPISAIRWMAKNGQSSNPDDPFFDEFGLSYDAGYIEPLSAPGEIVNREVLARTQAWSWVGPEAIEDPETDVAGVDWINPTLWYPYQRPTFVTPNFAGYVSGHSTYSSTAAYVLEALTGSPYFPGGVGEFVATKDEFLVFEQGPSEDVVLQWATYRDASDQTSLSRIWGGIHPPVDDIPGRRIGVLVGEDAMDKAFDLFEEDASSTDEAGTAARGGLRIFPNPAVGQQFSVLLPDALPHELIVYDALGKVVRRVHEVRSFTRVDLGGQTAGVYFVAVPGLTTQRVVLQ